MHFLFLSSKWFSFLSTYSWQLDDFSFISFVVLGTIRSAVGSAQLLMSQKFEQFRGLCNENLVSGSITSNWIPLLIHVFVGLSTSDPISFIFWPTHTDMQKYSCYLRKEITQNIKFLKIYQVRYTVTDFCSLGTLDSIVQLFLLARFSLLMVQRCWNLIISESWKLSNFIFPLSICFKGSGLENMDGWIHLLYTVSLSSH